MAFVDQIVSDVEAALIAKLSGCKSSSIDCQLSVVRSLGNARLPGTVDTLVELAVSSKHSDVSEAALSSLTRFDTSVILNSPQVVCSTVLLTFIHKRHVFYRVCAIRRLRFVSCLINQ